MNNMMFTTCRYLRDLGYDASLFLFKGEAFMPADDSYDEDYLNYTFELDVDRSSLNKDCSKISTQLKNYDFLIGNDIAPALMTRIGRVLDVFVPHGTDMYAYPFPIKKEKNVDGIWWLNSIRLLSKLQKKNISKIPVFLFPDEYDIHFPYKHKLKYTGQFYNFSVPMLYHPQYNRSISDPLFKQLEYFNFFNEIRRNFDFMVFSHSRQNGIIKDESMKVHEKGNLQLIEGFSAFLKETSKKAVLVLFEYGLDIESAKKLITVLNIEKHVLWAPKMKRKEIMFGLKLADVGCGQFVNSWLTCGVVNETLAAETLLLHYRNDELYSKDYDELYPLLNANSPAEIKTQLFKLESGEIDFSNDEKKGAEWLKKYSVDQAMKVIVKAIESEDAKKYMTRFDKFSCSICMAKHKIALKLMSAKQRFNKT